MVPPASREGGKGRSRGEVTSLQPDIFGRKFAEVTLFFQQIGEPPRPHQGGVSTGLIASSFPGNWNSVWGGGREGGEYSPYQRWQMAI